MSSMVKTLTHVCQAAQSPKKTMSESIGAPSTTWTKACQWKWSHKVHLPSKIKHKPHNQPNKEESRSIARSWKNALICSNQSRMFAGTLNWCWLYSRLISLSLSTNRWQLWTALRPTYATSSSKEPKTWSLKSRMPSMTRSSLARTPLRCTQSSWTLSIRQTLLSNRQSLPTSQSLAKFLKSKTKLCSLQTFKCKDSFLRKTNKSANLRSRSKRLHKRRLTRNRFLRRSQSPTKPPPERNQATIIHLTINRWLSRLSTSRKSLWLSKSATT